VPQEGQPRVTGRKPKVSRVLCARHRPHHARPGVVSPTNERTSRLA
jgi:hypothetical protein